MSSMPPWFPSRYLPEELGTESLLYMVRDYPGGVRLKIELESTGDLPSFLPRDAAIRLVCHGFLEWLPSEALDDVWGNIHDAWESYRRPALPARRMEQPLFVLNRIFNPVEEKPFTLTEE